MITLKPMKNNKDHSVIDSKGYILGKLMQRGWETIDNSPEWFFLASSVQKPITAIELKEISEAMQLLNQIAGINK